jgi:hypothetical protein
MKPAIKNQDEEVISADQDKNGIEVRNRLKELG